MRKKRLYIYTSICKIKRECINIVRRVCPSYTTEALFCVPPGGRQTSIATSTKTMMIRTCAHSTFHVLPPPSPSHSRQQPNQPPSARISHINDACMASVIHSYVLAHVPFDIIKPMSPPPMHSVQPAVIMRLKPPSPPLLPLPIASSSSPTCRHYIIHSSRICTHARGAGDGGRCERDSVQQQAALDRKGGC